jgi:hypothetical protein
MEPQKLLTSPNLDIASEELKHELGRWFSIYETLTDALSKKPYGIAPEWRFYKDGGAWLCKMTRKKKTVFWISAWKQFLKCGFYFTQKTGVGIADLSIDQSLKSLYTNTTPVGRLHPLEIDITNKKQLDDLYTVAGYKITQN